MKISICLLLLGCIFFNNNVGAQTTKDKMLPVVTITASDSSLNQKVRNAFESSFKNGENMHWFEANQNYLVKFIQDDQEHNVLYKKSGRPIYHITYGYEKNLPKATLNLIKSRYKDFKISRVFNIQQDHRDIWIVNIENKDYVILSRIEDNILNEVKRSLNTTANEVTASN